MSEIINMKKAGSFKPGKLIACIVIVLLLIILVFNSFTTVDAGHTGVVTTFGKVNDTVLQEGLHFKIPFVQQIIEVDNRVLKAEVQCSSASKDLQTVSSVIALNYRVSTASSANLYKNVGLDFQNTIVNPAIQECVKAITAKFTAEELITNRQTVGDQMRDILQQKIQPYGLNIEVFNIITFDFSEEFNAAIEAKQTAQQNALKAEQDLARIKVEAQQKIEQAKAEAEAYKLKSQQITDAMILIEYINKWDGKLPTVVSDSNSMFDLSTILDQAKTSTNTTYNYVTPDTENSDTETTNP